LKAYSVSPDHDTLFDSFQNSINTFSQKGRVILLGDFNARTSNLNDFIDLDNISHTNSNSYLPTNYSADLPLIRRQNMDTSINEQGKHLIDLCIESKIRILNGRVMGDSLGSFTYYCTQGKSCIDYIVSEDIVNSFNFLHVLPPNELSDHCIIWFSLKTPNSLDSITKCKQDDIYTYSIPGKFCVDNGKSDYITLLENDEDQAIEYFLLHVYDPDKDINVLTEQLTNIMINAAKNLFDLNHLRKRRTRRNTTGLMAIAFL
jgi:hypothetical protein